MLTLPCLHLWSEKRQTTSTTLHISTCIWIVSSRNILTGCESEVPDCPCKVGIAPLYRNRLCASLQGYSPARFRKWSSVNCAAHTLIFGLNCSGTVLKIQLNHWFLVVSSFGSPNKVVSLSQRTASPGHRADGSNSATARIIITPSFFAYTFGRCYANLPTPWRRHVGACLNKAF